MINVFFPAAAFFPSQIGGPCNTIYWHTSELNNKGVGVSIVASVLGVKFGDVITDENLELECGSVYYSKSTSLDLKTICRIFNEIKKNRVIHLNGLFNIYSLLSFYIITFFFRDKKKVIISPRGELNPNALKFSFRIKKIFLKGYKFFGKRSLYHATSDMEKKDIKGVLGDVKIINIPNLIKPATREICDKCNEVLYLGRIHPIKKVENLIKSVTLSKAFFDRGFKLVIVGKSEARYQEYYDKLIQTIKKYSLDDRVILRGHLEGKSKELAYSKAYCLVLPSETENFGNVVVEALNQRTPVIASLGTPWEILEDYGAGYHVDNSPEALAMSIEKLLDIPSESYLEMQRNSIRLVDEKFNVETQIENWIEVYKEMYYEK